MLEELRRDGFTRVKVDGEQRLLEEPIELDKKFKHTIEVVVDRLVMKQDLRQRLNAVHRDSDQPGRGPSRPSTSSRVTSWSSARTSPARSTASRCPSSSRGSSPSTRRTVPVRAVRASARSSRSTRTSSFPTASLTIGDGALIPWAVGNGGFYESVIHAVAERYEIDLDTPWSELTDEQQNYFLYGTGGERIYVTYRNRMGRRRQYTMAFEMLVSSLQRRYRETDSTQQRERIEEPMSFLRRPSARELA